MKGPQSTIHVSCLLLLVNVIAGNDVITFNQEALDEDNVETALETEHFIEVVDRHNPKRAQLSSHSSSLPGLSHDFGLAVNYSSQPWQPLPETSTPSLSSSLRERTFQSLSNYSTPDPGSRTRMDGWRPNDQWQDLSQDYQEIDEFEPEEYFLPGQGDLSERNYRYKRQVIEVSGMQQAQLYLNLSDASINDTSEKAVAQALTDYLRQSTGDNSITVEVDSLRPGSVLVNATILTSSDTANRTALAASLDALKFLKVGNKIYSVFDVMLEPTVGTDLMPVRCFFCDKNYETCSFNSQQNLWECKFNDFTGTFYLFGSSQGDSTLRANDEYYTGRIRLNPPIAYNQNTVSSVYVSVNGLISFDEPFSSFIPIPCPVLNNNGQIFKMVAPYWADLDLVSNDEGRVYYQNYEVNSGNRSRSQLVINRANRDVLERTGMTFSATGVMVFTWYKMPPWPATVNKDERVTFQAVIIYNLEYTYIQLIYPPNGMKFNPLRRRSVVVCANDNNLDSSRINYYKFGDIIGNTGALGQWFFRIGQVQNSRTKCLLWYQRELDDSYYVDFFRRFVPRCPCSEISALLSFEWLPSFLQDGCYESFPIFGQFGRRCCYRGFGFLGSVENRVPFSGNFQRYTPYSLQLGNHEKFDAAPKRWCCFESNLCSLYYQVRPRGRCVPRITWRGFFFGDPHMKTLDGRSWIFNGHGEYRLLEVKSDSINKTVDFKLQARTCRPLNINGSLSLATIFCAFAVQTTNGTKVIVEIHSSGKYMVIYAKEQDFTARFRDNGNFSAKTGQIFLQRVNDSLLISTPDDIGLYVTLTNNLLDFSVEVSGTYRNNNVVRGLLGNFDGDSSNDFIFPNGTMLSNSTGERPLYEYGKTWAVNDNTSIFDYGPGENSSNFADPNFEPIFLSEANETDKLEAERICQSKTNFACIYDYIATKNEALAIGSKDAGDKFDKEEEELSNNPPVLTFDNSTQVTVNKPFTITIFGADEDNDMFTYTQVSGPVLNFTTVNGTILSASYTLLDTSPVEFEFAAVDSKGLQSEIVQIPLTLCSGCNGRGNCSFSEEKRSINSSNFALATCECFPPWTGENCEEDKDGCENKPCAEGQNCTDVPAGQENITNVAFTCSQCPDGYYLDNSSQKCEDIDECSNSSFCGPYGACVNIIGSFECGCKSGFRKSGPRECRDINECTDFTNDCQQICTNTIGSFLCSCYPGFKFNNFTRRCNKTEDVCAGLVEEKNCSYGCLNSSGVAECFCSVGYKTAPDGTCVDVDECQQNICSQKCVNSDGSYECSCWDGYSLTDDRQSCETCPENKYGTNCKKECYCYGRSTGCDHIKGCLCNPSWTGPHCQEDVDECTSLVSPCAVDRNCTNTNGSFTCDCYRGYQDNGINGTCVNVDECASYDLNDCPELEVPTCRDTIGSYVCFCPDGFLYNRTSNSCQDIDECALGISGCQFSCMNMEGSFNCECPEEDGLTLADDRRNCIQDAFPCKNFSLNNNCSFACKLDADKQPVCFCGAGYSLGADNTTCQDIDECTNTTLHGCSNTCINTNGSYLCACPNGTKMSGDKRTCQVCDGDTWGYNCDRDCSCNIKGSSSCNPVSGCMCQPGWMGPTCDSDIDECASTKKQCPDAQDCVNTIGSYRCQCKTGYQPQNDTCIDINECSQTPSPCDQICNNTEGSYNCSCFNKGFMIANDKCIDIDECERPELNRCDQLCRNSIGSFACECYNGFILNTTTRNTCYRDPFAKDCIITNCSYMCAVENGRDVCFCPPGYELAANGFNCTNKNECLNSPCIGGTCTDTDGSFFCTCDPDFNLSSDNLTCQVKTTNFTLMLELDYSNTEIIDLGDIFTTGSANFTKLANEVQRSIFTFGIYAIGSAFVSVQVLQFRYGSVIADTSFETFSDNPSRDATVFVKRLAEGGQLQLNGKMVTVSTIIINNINVTNDTSECEIFNRLNKTCIDNKIECKEDFDNSTRLCEKEVTTPKTSTESPAAQTNNDKLIIGLAVGLPLFILLILLVALLAVFYVRRRRRRSQQQSSTLSEDYESPFRNKIVTKGSTVGSWGPQQLYAPGTVSEAGSAESGAGGMLRVGQRGRSDFTDSAWYDNKGATPYAVQENGESSTEAGKPTSNFSWEYMFRLLEPIGEDYQIQRPFIDPRPNPAFITNSNHSNSSA